MVGTNNNTPVRNRKVGLPDPQGNGGQVATLQNPNAPAQKVVEAAQQSFAMKNGGQMPMSGNGTGTPPPVATVNPNNGMMFFGNNNQVRGKFEAQPVQTGAVPTTDFTNMKKPEEFVPQGNDNANPTVGPVNTPYMKDAADATPQPQTSFEGMQAVQQPTGWNPDGTPNYGSLSAALNGGGNVQPQQAAQAFQADPEQKDGGFFNWVKGLIPKKRPGRREGETDDEYDRRHTRNMQMWATLADAIRHMGNIVNTSKGAPLQQFNDPTTMLEQGYQNRKAQRQKQAALDADQAYKNANLTLKERAAEADRLYKQMTLGYKDAADKRAAQAAQYKTDYFNWQKEEAAKNRERQAAQDKQKQDNWEKQFNENTRHHKASESISRSKGRGGGSGAHGGSGGKYWFEDKDGKMHYQPNKTMYEQEYFREYGRLPEGETTTSTSTKTIDYKTGQETTITKRSKGNSMTAQAAAQQNKAKADRKKTTQKSKNGYKNTKKLGL